MDKKLFSLFLLPNGDVEICKVLDDEGSFFTVYHKKFLPGENVKKNLLAAYDALLAYRNEVPEDDD